MDEKFAENLLRLIAAQNAFRNALLASSELLGKSYLSLGLAEKFAVDQTVAAALVVNFQAITPEYFASPQSAPAMGFPTQGGTSKAGGSKD